MARRRTSPLLGGRKGRVFAVLALAAAMLAPAGGRLAADWPQARWRTLAQEDPAAHAKLLARPACRHDFIPLATARAAEPDGLKTDGLVVVRQGRIVYEYYDGVYGPADPHALWSASKSVTATLLGAAIQRQARLPGGDRLSLDTPVHRIFPADLRAGIADRSGDDAYRRIKVADLVRMTAGFQWEESYESEVKDSSVLRMLYIDGFADMPRFALRQPMMVEGPGRRWLYSGGNANLVMGILKRVYGARYDAVPWELLFSRIGIPADPPGTRGPVFERDGAGNFVGSSYVHMTPRDMARLGYLYLKDGMWGDDRILPEGWVDAARTFNAAQGDLSFGSAYVAYVNREGLFSERSFWLNVEVPGLAVQFPAAPRDMYFAAGHYGQLIIVLPSHGMVVARTGHDAEYWSKIDAFVSKALRCFADD